MKKIGKFFKKAPKERHRTLSLIDVTQPPPAELRRRNTDDNLPSRPTTQFSGQYECVDQDDNLPQLSGSNRNKRQTWASSDVLSCPAGNNMSKVSFSENGNVEEITTQAEWKNIDTKHFKTFETREPPERSHERTMSMSQSQYLQREELNEGLRAQSTSEQRDRISQASYQNTQVRNTDDHTNFAERNTSGQGNLSTGNSQNGERRMNRPYLGRTLQESNNQNSLSQQENRQQSTASFIEGNVSNISTAAIWQNIDTQNFKTYQSGNALGLQTDENMGPQNVIAFVDQISKHILNSINLMESRLIDRLETMSQKIERLEKNQEMILKTVTFPQMGIPENQN